jgi:hypothetical protein
MAVGRQLNVKGQMRIDVPHLRLIESGVVYDFDTLAGGILAGKLPYVVTGFVPATWVNGAAASSLSLVTANGIFVNYQASENGSMLMVPADRAPEQLSITNSRVSGNFTVSQTNYVSLDLTRTEDATTSDVVHFIDPATGQGTPKIIPLGRTMDYQIHITTSPFSTNPQRCPVMIVVTDAANNIVSVADARPMMFRLAAGGDTPSALSKYAWPEGRNVGVTPANESALFTGGDKAIGDMKSWISAMTEMIWQINAGEYWYSNTQMTSTWFMPSGTNAWGWNLGTETISWSSQLEIVFTGSTAMHNIIAAGSAVLTADTALYVDFNRYTNGATLVPAVGPISTLNGEPATPGIRYPIAWRVGSGTPAVRNLPVPAGASPVGLATTVTSGSVFINSANATPYAVISTGLNGRALATGLQRPSGTGALEIGVTTNETSITIGGGVNNQAINIGFSSATLGTTAVYGKIVVLGMSSGTAQMNTGIAQIGCTAGATISIGVNSDTTVNINTGASVTATTAIGTSTIGTVQIRGAAVNINTAGAAATTTIGHATAGSTTIESGTSGTYVRGSAAGSNPILIVKQTAGTTMPYFRCIDSSDVMRFVVSSTGSINSTVATNGTAAFTMAADTGGHYGIIAFNHSTRVASFVTDQDNGMAITDTVPSIDFRFGGTPKVTISNAGTVTAGTATLYTDPVLTLTTKAYVDNQNGPWQAPGLTWINTYGSEATHAFRYTFYHKDPIAPNGSSWISFRGWIDAGATPGGSSMITLDANARPTQSMYFRTLACNSTETSWYPCLVSILTNGIVTADYIPTVPGALTTPVANMKIIMDGITYPLW